MLYDFAVDNFSAACCKLTTGKHFSSAILRQNSVYKNKSKEQKQLKIYDIEMKEMIDSLLYSLYLSSIWGVITVKRWSRQQQRGKPGGCCWPAVESPGGCRWPAACFTNMD